MGTGSPSKLCNSTTHWDSLCVHTQPPTESTRLSFSWNHGHNHKKGERERERERDRDVRWEMRERNCAKRICIRMPISAFVCLSARVFHYGYPFSILIHQKPYMFSYPSMDAALILCSLFSNREGDEEILTSAPLARKRAWAAHTRAHASLHTHNFTHSRTRFCAHKHGPTQHVRTQ